MTNRPTTPNPAEDFSLLCSALPFLFPGVIAGRRSNLPSQPTRAASRRPTSPHAACSYGTPSRSHLGGVSCAGAFIFFRS